MAVMTKAQAKKFNEMTDKMIDVLNFLKSNNVIVLMPIYLIFFLLDSKHSEIG